MVLQFILSTLLTLTFMKITVAWEQCDMCNPDLKDMLNRLREQIDMIEEQFFSCCPECPAGYTAINGHCYKLSQDELPWQQAMDSCVMQGARLVALETKEEEEALTRYIEKHRDNLPYPLRYYTSGNSVVGKWTWGQGQEAQPFSYTNWLPNEPNDHQGESEKCLDWHVGEGWNDVACYLPFRYVCEHISDTDITQNDYTDYMTAAKMNVDYLKGQGISSDDDFKVQGQIFQNEIPERQGIKSSHNQAQKAHISRAKGQGKTSNHQGHPQGQAFGQRHQHKNHHHGQHRATHRHHGNEQTEQNEIQFNNQVEAPVGTTTAPPGVITQATSSSQTTTPLKRNY